MKLAYQVEPLSALERDIWPLLPLHWEELALDKSQMKMDVFVSRYKEFEQNGNLHIVTVRDQGRLVGYFILMLGEHLHYHGAGRMAYTDVYFILPEFRKGGAGVKLFAEVERTLRERGIVKAYFTCKVHQDHSSIFERLGWNWTDKVFTKVFSN